MSQRFFGSGGWSDGYDGWAGDLGDDRDVTTPSMLKGKGEPVAKAAQPLDPTIVRALTHFGVYEGPETLATLDKPRAYLFTAKGVKIVSKGLIGTFVADAKEIPAVGELSNGLTLSIPKLPWDHLRDTVALFRYVAAKQRAEVMVQFFWDLQEKAYVAFCPKQRVSGGSIHHEGDFDKENSGRYAHVLDIHSHVEMSAFWSGTDDADEKRFENRLFGVIGKVSSKVPEMNWRARVGGQFVDLKTHEVVEVPTLSTTVTINMGHILDSKGGGVNQKIEVDPFEGATFPEEWLGSLVEGVPFRHGDQVDRRNHGWSQGAREVVTKQPFYVIDHSTKVIYLEDSLTKELYPSCFKSPDDIRKRWGSAVICWKNVDTKLIRGPQHHLLKGSSHHVI